MKTNRFHLQKAGFTAVELSIYILISVILAGFSFSVLLSSVSLTNKNSNLNRSHDDLRLAFDRLAHNLSASNNVPTLIDTNGSTVTTSGGAAAGPMPGTLTGPAAGIKFDRVISEPFVVESPQTANNPLAAGTVASTATSLNVLYAKNLLTHVVHITPTSTATTLATAGLDGLILLVPQPNGVPLRLRIASTGARSSPNSDWNKLPLTFTGQVGTGFSWGANQPQLVKIVRSEAFIVFRKETGTPREYCELRYYKNFDPMPNLNDASKYTVLCTQIGIKTDEDKPFAIVDYNGDKFVQSTLRVRERGGGSKNVGAQGIGGGANEPFYTYFQLHVNLPSRFRPRTTL